jgi:LacI family transcriptional regulator
LENISITRLVDVAAAAGVSRPTAAKVLLGSGGKNTRVSDKTAGRIRKVAEKLHWKPNLIAQQLKGKASHVIGVLIGAETSRVNQERLCAIELEAFRRGYRLMVGHVRGDDNRFVEYLHEFEAHKVDGIISLHHPSDDFVRGHSDLLRGFQQILFLDYSPLPDSACVRIDRAAGVCEACRHLHEQSRRRIALAVTVPETFYMRQRIQGYKKGLQDIHQKEKLIWSTGESARVPPDDLVDQLVREMVTKLHADAIIAPDDVWASLIIKSLRRCGKNVPHDVAVVGFDNDPELTVAADPSLTSIDQQSGILAKRTVDLLLDRLDNPEIANATKLHIIPARLVIRESSLTSLESDT